MTTIPVSYGALGEDVVVRLVEATEIVTLFSDGSVRLGDGQTARGARDRMRAVLKETGAKPSDDWRQIFAALDKIDKERP